MNTVKAKNFIEVYFNFRMLVTLLLGFASGLPLALSGSTLQAWMASEKVDLTIIGIFSLVGLPYSFKFVWAPLMDRFVPPILGRRRGWIAVSQVCLMIAIAGMAFTNPIEGPWLVAFAAVCVAFFSASQDIVIDAYRTELVSSEERGVAAGYYIMGYRIAMLTSGAIALILSDHLPWKMVYFIMAMAMGVGVITTLIAPDNGEADKELAPKSIVEAFVKPLLDYFKRRGAIEVLIFILLFKLGDVIAGTMTTPFLIGLGFSKTEIGTLNKFFGMAATVLGTLTGGGLIVKLGTVRAMWVFGIMQALSNFVFIALAKIGMNTSLLVAAVGVENFCGGMGTAGFTAFMMSLCNKRFTASQYALLSSLMAVPRIFIAAPTGFIAKTYGWENYYYFSILCAIPGILMLTRYKRWATAD